MELSNLVFKVDTSSLDVALKKIDDLGKATEGLAKSTADLAKSSKDAAGATNALAKAKDQDKKSTEQSAQAVEKVAKASQTMLERQKEIFSFMGQGFSKGQASILATAKATGQWSDELGQVLLAQRKLQGGDPFDKSLGAINRVKNEFAELRDEMRMTGAGVELTAKQYRELTRAKIGVIEVMKSQGAGFSEIRNRIRSLNAEYIGLAQQNNVLLAAEKEQERQSRQNANAAINAAKATSFVERELNRAENALAGLNNEMYISTSNRLLKFQQQLAASNMPLEKQIALMNQYKKTLEATDATRRRQKTADSNRQVDLLARSLAPQISDVAVSLAGGMNPFTVLMQQGLQVRDLMQLSGVEAERMGEAFKKAGAGMISTSVAAAKAIGSMFTGVIIDAGQSVTDFGLKMIGLDKKFLALQMNLGRMQAQSTGIKSAIAGIASSALSLVPVITGVGVALAAMVPVALLVALYQVVKQENELNRVLTLNQAAIGATYDSAYTLAKAYGEVNGNTNRALVVMQEMAKAGNLSVKSFDGIADAAIAMNKATGASIEETVKKFSDLAKEPSKVLSSFMEQTGLIDIETMKLVRSLELAGDRSGAAAVAIKAYGEATQQAAQEVRDNYGTLTSLAIEIKGLFTSAWDAILGIGRKGTLQDQISAAEAEVRRLARLYSGQDVGTFGSNELEQAEAKLRALKRQEEQEKNNLKTRQENARFSKLQSDIDSAKASAMSSYQRETNKWIHEEVKLRERLALVTKGSSEEKVLLEQLNQVKEIRNDLEDKYVKSLERQNKKSTKKTDEQKAAESAYKKYLSFVQDMKVQAAEAGTAQGELTEAQRAMIALLASDQWRNLAPDNQQKALSFFYLAHGAQEAAKELEKLRKQSEMIVSERNKNAETAFKQLEAVKGLQKSAEDESELLRYEASLVGVVSEERKRLIAIKKIELELEKEKAKILSDNLLTDANKADQIAAQVKLAQTKIQNINTSIANDLNEKMVDGVTDAIVTGLFEGGEAGKKKLRDLIVAELQRPITLFIRAFVSDIFGLGGGQGGGGIGGTLQQASNLYSTANNYFNNAGNKGAMYAEAFNSATGGSLTALNYGTNIGSQQTMMLAAQESGMGAAATWGQTAGMYAAGAAGGIYAGRAISNGYSAWGNSGNAAVNLGTVAGGVAGMSSAAAGAYAGAWAGPIGMVIGGIIGGLVNVAFGRKLKEQGIRAMFQGGQVAGVENYKFEKGGWFSSDRTTSSAADAGTVKQVTQDAEQIKQQALGMAHALGLNAAAVEQYSGALKVNLKGVKTAEEASQRYAEGLENLYIDMLKATGGLDAFRRSGESLEVTLQRLTQEAMSLAEAAGFSGSQLTQSLVAGMTGQMSASDVGASLTNIIIGSIYNSLAMGFAEQITGAITGLIIQPIMTAVLTGGSISQAVSQASIQAVVNQAQAAMQAFSVIINDPAFIGLMNQIKGMITTVSGLSTQPAANVMKFGNAVRSTSTAASEARRAWQQIIDDIIDEIKRLRGEVIGTDTRSLEYYQSRFAIKTAQARSGNRTAAEELPELSRTIEELIRMNAISSYEVRVQQAQLMASLATTAQVLSRRFRINLPALATGTNYVQEDMIAQLHEGEAVVPKAYNPAAGGSSNVSMDEVVEELRMLRIEVRAGVSASTKTAKILDRITPDGESLNTKVVT